MTGSPVTDGSVKGSTAPGFEPVAEEFGRLLAQEGDAHGQFCAYLRGRRVVDLWGGDDVAVRVALSHQAGIPGVKPQLTLAEVMDHDLVAARLAAQVPHWRPGKAHGYHGLTIGTIIDELVRRVAGAPVAEFFTAASRAVSSNTVG
ncbi:MAG TPA: serine hydrolase domain-containing protein [Trebonia sp.]|jgi:CubicO group peptidase (beta-lactamase class C family)